MAGRTLYATSDLHIRYPANRELVEAMHPASPDDWLLVAGDVGEYAADVEWALTLLSSRFARVVWTPGNHELWTMPDDPVTLRGEARYDFFVDMCRSLGILTPEDDYAVWEGPGGPLALAPLFVSYDYSFRVDGDADKDAALARAYESGVVARDELLLHPDPHASREAWCRSRVTLTEARLDACDPGVPLVLVNHYPLVREPTRVLRYPPFAIWCGTDLTADWHRRYRVARMIYGHLHIPRTTWHDGVRFDEVSVGYPREWRARSTPMRPLRVIDGDAADA